MAALMVVEDAIGAIEGYADAAPFNFDEAYLAKCGLLQGLQVGFDGAESVATVLGVRSHTPRSKPTTTIPEAPTPREAPPHSACLASRSAE